MSKLWTRYTTELYDQLGYRGTWFPSTPIELGTVGVLREGVLDPVTTLRQLGINFDQSHEEAPDGSLDYKSDKSVSVTLKASGQSSTGFASLASVDAGALVQFGANGGVLLELRGISIEHIADKAALASDLLDAILAADYAERWQRDWVVITDVVKVEVATIAVSQGGSGRLELRSSLQLAPSGLADAQAGLAVASESNIGLRLVAQAGLTPLYRGVRVKRKFWSLYDTVLPAGDELDADVFDDHLDPRSDVQTEDEVAP